VSEKMLKDFPIQKIEEDMLIGKSVFLPNGQLFLPGGFLISNTVLPKLQASGVKNIMIDENNNGEAPQHAILKHTSDLMQLPPNIQELDVNLKIFKEEALEIISDRIKKTDGNLRNLLLSSNLESKVTKVINEILDEPKILYNLNKLKEFDTYYFHHSLNVTVISLLIGLNYKCGISEQKALAMGGYLLRLGDVFYSRWNFPQARQAY